jgi:adenosylmethionine---8-amino-7-oxononanoate aminotransferase
MNVGESTIIDRDHIWHPFTSFTNGVSPIHVTHATGLYLYTADGRRIMDMISSWWVNLHGHSNPVIAEAIAKQAKTLEHVIFAGFTHEPAIHLAKNLLSVLPENQNRIFFSDNGSTAVEVGIKMALQFWYNQGVTKKRIIALDGAYHGDTFGSMSVGERSAFTQAFGPYLFDVEFIPVPTRENFKEVFQEFETKVVAGDVAAFIYEPLVQGAAGMIMYEAELLDELLGTAAKHQVVCIADEVFTGFGRTGKWFASLYMKHLPDIMCISKGITGGTMPLGVTTCSERIVTPFVSEDIRHTFYHGHSYTGNPLACAVANASFKLTSASSTWERISEIHQNHLQFIGSIQRHPMVAEARCVGTILAVELRTRNTTSYFNEMRKRIYDYFLEKDILLRPLGNVIYVLPPYIITDSELHYVYETIAAFLNEVELSSRN